MIHISLRRLTVDFPPGPQRDISLFFLSLAEDQVVVSSDYDSTHEANHSDSSDVAHTCTEEDAEDGKSPPQNVILHTLIPPEVRRGRAAVTLVRAPAPEPITTHHGPLFYRTNRFWRQNRY